MVDEVLSKNYNLEVDEMDRRIMQLRALGFRQEEIAGKLGISQGTVSQRLLGINKLAREHEPENLESFFVGLLLGGFIVALIAEALSRR